MTPPRDSIRQPSLSGWIPALILLALLLLAGCFHLTRQSALEDLRHAQAVDMRSRAQALESILSRQRAVATVLADDALVLGALRDPSAENRARVSQKLDRLRNQTDSAVIYLLDQGGIAISASNWGESTSFIGMDYSFRDYFTQAIAGGEAAQFALGTVSHRPGLYLSHDVKDAAKPLGVVVVKVEFDRLEANWGGASARTDVLDRDGQIILSSDPALRFTRDPRVPHGAVVTTARVPGTGWTLVVTSSGRQATQKALLATGTAGFALTLLGVAGAVALRARRRAARRAEDERRYRADLQEAVEQRTRALSRQMRERRALEERMERLRGEMVQANKLAALGQITAGVAHEVNQPLATIRLLAENAETLQANGEGGEVLDNLARIRRMTDRISRITEQLRGFARKATGQIGPVALSDALEVALLLTAPQREAQRIRLEMPAIPPDLRVRAEKVALEQVLVNLLQNAQEALADRPDPCITVALDLSRVVRITISDNGPGLAPEIAAQLFTPFVTSKPRGLGLGLVISQDLARDIGGSLRAAPPEPGRGASFILELARSE